MKSYAKNVVAENVVEEPHPDYPREYALTEFYFLCPHCRKQHHKTERMHEGRLDFIFYGMECGPVLVRMPWTPLPAIAVRRRKREQAAFESGERARMQAELAKPWSE
jgi:hypothetical protein